ncbi:MAG: hypothetical protein COW03_09395 [Cytophagales bacterium CG12_big_fil_rev_8_21_14_0_65_40_12]|nr:MAG: hypothetical protein COW03_09395 [Cytophagales bacterium CG12_big_fil_rev_8_21_14_0_65_40_12]PIW05529.1 MAG: hypothetical protein COW40_03515 [Cytophagales bacterium CG17_big_fil_post_rev_8_21_14_2_50_40_13]
MESKKLRIGILTESNHLPAWSYKMLEHLLSFDCAEIVLNIKKKSTSTPKRSFFSKLISEPQHALFFLYKKYDERRNSPKPSAFTLRPLESLIQCETLEVVPKSTKFSDRFSQEDLDIIKTYEIDILVRLGFNILRGDILKVARYGVWSYHHGDNHLNRGGPAGTWEVLNHWPETGALLQILTEDLDGGIQLDTCSIQTQKKSLIKNRNMLYWKSCGMLPLKVKELYDLGEESFFQKIDKLNSGISLYDAPLYKMPKNRDMFSPLWTKLMLRLGRRFYKMFYFDQWILLFEWNTNNKLASSFFRFKRILPPKDRIWADPFLIERNGKHYVFLEELILGKRKKAHISVMELDKKGNYTTPIKVIEEDWHLSYPFVFLHNDRLYLIPESNENNTVDLYVSRQFPFQWERNKTLLSNIKASDTTLFYHNSLFWMFTAVAPIPGTSTLDELYLYYSDDIESENWKPHPKNPIVKHARFARPAGSIFEYNGKLIRPSQNNAGHYGAGINFQEILILNENEYLEQNMESVSPNWDKDLISAHTFNRLGGLTIIDALIKRRK